MSNYYKTITSKYPYCAVETKRTVGIFASYCFTTIGHYILLQSSLFRYFLSWYYIVPTLVKIPILFLILVHELFLQVLDH